MSATVPTRLVGALHRHLVFGRRVRVLAEHLASLIPTGASVLDVGCGDGRIDACLMRLRADLVIDGLDVMARRDSLVPVGVFDGCRVPLEDGSRDVVMLVDVLHHAEDAAALLAESVRVARGVLVIKDHLAETRWAVARLRFMDWVGNRPHGVRLPFNFWPAARWAEAWSVLGLRVVEERRMLGLYPTPFRPLFENGLHFLARLEPNR